MDNKKPVCGEIYKHYKGKQYKILALGRHSETLEEMVVYEALYESKDFGMNAVWVRPLSMFFETVEYDGGTIPRFVRSED